MRGLFIITGIVLFLIAVPCGLLHTGGGPYTLERSILAVGFAIAGGMCYIAAALHEAGRSVRGVCRDAEVRGGHRLTWLEAEEVFRESGLSEMRGGRGAP